MEADILYVCHVFDELLCPCKIFLKHDTHVDHGRICPFHYRQVCTGI